MTPNSTPNSWAVTGVDLRTDTHQMSESDLSSSDQTEVGPAPRSDGDVSLNFLLPPKGPGELGWLAHFRVLKVLGRGGMGIVFLAEDSNLQRLVALKVMRPEMASESMRKRFLREARACAALDENPHIVTIYHVGEERGVPFLAMQYLKGMPLNTWIKAHGYLPMPEVLRIGQETASGLATAHTRGLIHRDIKTANLWVESPSGRIKLLDFGLALPVEAQEEEGLTQSGQILGTPGYMSPEQSNGDNVDGRSDLFSLGCVLYELACGRPPYTGKGLLALVRALATETPTPLHVVNPNLPEAFSRLVARMMERSPESRFQTAEDVGRELRSIEMIMIATQQSETIVAPVVPPSPWPSAPANPSSITSVPSSQIPVAPSNPGSSVSRLPIAPSAPNVPAAPYPTAPSIPSVSATPYPSAPTGSSVVSLPVGANVADASVGRGGRAGARQQEAPAGGKNLQILIGISLTLCIILGVAMYVGRSVRGTVPEPEMPSDKKGEVVKDKPSKTVASVSPSKEVERPAPETRDDNIASLPIAEQRQRLMKSLELANTGFRPTSDSAFAVATGPDKKSIQSVVIEAEELSNLAALQALPELARVSINGKGKKVDLKALAGLSLTTIECKNSQVDLLDLAGMKSLEALDLSGSKIAHLERLSDFRLKSLALNQTSLDNLQALESLHTLRRLEIRGLPITGLDDIKDLQLEYLDFSDCMGIKKIDALNKVAIRSIRCTYVPSFAKILGGHSTLTTINGVPKEEFLQRN